jgi:hypothetical protein
MNRYEYAKALRKGLKHVGEFPAGYARLGKGDGAGTIVADATRRLVYVFEAVGSVPSAVPLDQGIDIRSLNNPTLEGFRVRLAYPSYAPDRVHVVGLDDGEGLQAVGGFTPQEQLTAALAVPQTANIADFRLSVVSGLTVMVNPGKYYQHGTGDWTYFGGDTLALTMPSTSGYHQLQLVCLDTDAGALAAVAGTAEAGSNKDVFDNTTIDALVVPDGYMPVGAVHCTQGVTTLTETDIYRNADPRVMFQARRTVVRYSTANVSNPPTDAELDAALGTPATVGAGYATVLNDNGAGTNEYFVWSDGSAWWYAAGTKAT